MKLNIILTFCFLLFYSVISIAQPRRELVQVIVTPDRGDWTYEVGERAEFTIQVLKNNVALEDIEVEYVIQPELVDVWDKGVIVLKKGMSTVRAKRFKEPGFLRCTATVEVDGKKYSSYATAGFSPEDIEPTTTLPEDFTAFWEKGKADLARVPMNPVMTLVPEQCTDKADVYHVELNNIQGKIYGMLSVPKKAGKHPAILHVPGAGIRPYNGITWEAAEGFISFNIGIHGIPVNLDPQVYKDLSSGALNGYPIFNLDNKDKAFYKRVYLGCVRALDFIESLPSFDGENIGVTGGSQGGALSIVTAGLDDRIDYLAAFYPALSDLTGFLHGRAGGWPKIFKEGYTNKPEKIETSKYFDVVNFARFVKAKGWYSWGYNDNVCPPTSMYAAYNVLTADKELHVFQETAHWTFPEQQVMKNEWLFNQLRN
ncbi:acetylxylan esterase [Membranihabitans marinus]|uniref:acetylxylan esterase n=1 Tax=Membranihabitans marinus TaxID=1227546 RepID=UPI001F45FCC0|nr:acetylxylan esterase [Membranihabitans marinus]